MYLLFFKLVLSHIYFLSHILLHKERIAIFEKPQSEEQNVSDEKDAKSSAQPRNRSSLIESKFLVYCTGLAFKVTLCLYAFCYGAVTTAAYMFLTGF